MPKRKETNCSTNIIQYNTTKHLRNVINMDVLIVLVLNLIFILTLFILFILSPFVFLKPEKKIATTNIK